MEAQQIENVIQSNISVLLGEYGWMFLAALAEVVSLGLALPFLGVLTSPEKVYQNELFSPVVSFFDISSWPPPLLVFLI